jgi:hypothetical protein
VSTILSQFQTALQHDDHSPSGPWPLCGNDRKIADCRTAVGLFGGVDERQRSRIRTRQIALRRRNGGAYLIREWNDDQSIARQAIANVVRFFANLRDAATKINPQFRLMTLMEPFYGEHEYMWKEFKDRLDIETTSLIAKGWSMPYTHPRYDDVKDINGGTIYQGQFSSQETEKIRELEERNSWSHFYFVVGPHSMFERSWEFPITRDLGKIAAHEKKTASTIWHISAVRCRRTWFPIMSTMKSLCVSIRFRNGYRSHDR